MGIAYIIQLQKNEVADEKSGGGLQLENKDLISIAWQTSDAMVEKP
jgi:hypothetical protein